MTIFTTAAIEFLCGLPCEPFTSQFKASGLGIVQLRTIFSICNPLLPSITCAPLHTCYRCSLRASGQASAAASERATTTTKTTSITTIKIQRDVGPPSEDEGAFELAIPVGRSPPPPPPPPSGSPDGLTVNTHTVTPLPHDSHLWPPLSFACVRVCGSRRKLI